MVQRQPGVEPGEVVKRERAETECETAAGASPTDALRPHARRVVVRRRRAPVFVVRELGTPRTGPAGDRRLNFSNRLVEVDLPDTVFDCGIGRIRRALYTQGSYAGDWCCVKCVDVP